MCGPECPKPADIYKQTSTNYSTASGKVELNLVALRKANLAFLSATGLRITLKYMYFFLFPNKTYAVTSH